MHLYMYSCRRRKWIKMGGHSGACIGSKILNNGNRLKRCYRMTHSSRRRRRTQCIGNTILVNGNHLISTVQVDISCYVVTVVMWLKSLYCRVQWHRECICGETLMLTVRWWAWYNVRCKIQCDVVNINAGIILNTTTNDN